MADGNILVIGFDGPELRALGDALAARTVALEEGAVEHWRETLVAGPQAEAVVVALFRPLPAAGPLVDLDPSGWSRRADQPLLHWMTALGGAALACADGGCIVAVADCPPPLDAAELVPEAAVAEGVAALVRSLALSEGKRGVRANMVETPFRLVRRPPIAPDPPLSGFPGTLEQDVLGSVRLLLSPDGAHFSGHVFPADRGRSW